MTLPRPVLLALLGLALIGAALLGTRGMRSTGGEPAPAPAPKAQPAEAPAPAEKPATKPESPSRAAERSRGGDPGGGAAGAGAPVDPLGTLPRRIERPVRRHRLVVLMLAQPGASDDADVKRAAKALEPAGARVFIDDIDQVRRYAAIASAVGVSQAPSTVVVTPDRRARLVEGYVDRKTLRQLLVDAIRG